MRSSAEVLLVDGAKEILEGKKGRVRGTDLNVPTRAPPGTRTLNPRIKRPERLVRSVLDSAAEQDVRPPSRPANAAPTTLCRVVSRQDSFPRNPDSSDRRQS